MPSDSDTSSSLRLFLAYSADRAASSSPFSMAARNAAIPKV